MPKSYLFVLILTLTVFLCTSAAKNKVNENGHTATHGTYCGDQMIEMYNEICGYGYRKRRRRSLIMNNNDARSFIHNRSKRSFTMVEECCVESCKYEEIREYCL